MSDEEREALEIVKGITEDDLLNYWEGPEEPYNAIQTILNLIEKQSKEIEELKTQIDEHVYYDLGGRSCGKTELLRHYKKGYDMNNKFWKDKIKVKIEEVEKEIDKLYKKKNWYEPWDTEKKNKYMHYIEFGQSLLEKE